MKSTHASILFALTISLVGCGSWPLTGTLLSTSSDRQTADQTERPSGPHVRIEFHDPGEQPQLGILPLPPEGHLFVSEALKEAQVRKRLSRFNVEVYRPTSNGYQRMTVKMATGHRDVVSQYDYALRSGDRLVITPDSSDSIDDMIKSFSGPLRLF
jgi:hypothetical protein